MSERFPPDFKPPDLTGILQVPDFSRLIGVSKPFLDLSERMREVSKAWQAALEPLRKPLRTWAKEAERCRIFEEEGWLPHWSTPFHLIEGHDLETFDQRVHDFYRVEWTAIKRNLENSVQCATADKEALATFCEALEAHGHGLFRASTRLVFPEIERIARLALHDGDANKTITSQHELVAAIGHLHPGEMKSRGMPGFRLYMALRSTLMHKRRPRTKFHTFHRVRSRTVMQHCTGCSPIARRKRVSIPCFFSIMLLIL